MEKIAKKFALSKPGERITFTPKLFEFGGKIIFSPGSDSGLVQI